MFFTGTEYVPSSQSEYHEQCFPPIEGDGKINPNQEYIESLSQPQTNRPLLPPRSPGGAASPRPGGSGIGLSRPFSANGSIFSRSVASVSNKPPPSVSTCTIPGLPEETKATTGTVGTEGADTTSDFETSRENNSMLQLSIRDGDAESQTKGTSTKSGFLDLGGGKISSGKKDAGELSALTTQQGSGNPTVTQDFSQTNLISKSSNSNQMEGGSAVRPAFGVGAKRFSKSVSTGNLIKNSPASGLDGKDLSAGSSDRAKTLSKTKSQSYMFADGRTIDAEDLKKSPFGANKTSEVNLFLQIKINTH